PRHPGHPAAGHAAAAGDDGHPSEQTTPPTSGSDTGGSGGSGPQDVGSVGTGSGAAQEKDRDLSGVDVQGPASGSGSLNGELEEGTTPPQPGAQPGQSDTQPPR
ncbi:hypothetical protein ACLESD_42600, partial [Pyxidicoccus sp. 3LFB2]